MMNLDNSPTMSKKAKRGWSYQNITNKQIKQDIFLTFGAVTFNVSAMLYLDIGRQADAWLIHSTLHYKILCN